MRGAFGKPLGTVARVQIGQPIMSVRTLDKHKPHVIEALRRAKFKFPGRQKVLLRHKKLHFCQNFNILALLPDLRLQKVGIYQV